MITSVSNCFQKIWTQRKLNLISNGQSSVWHEYTWLSNVLHYNFSYNILEPKYEVSTENYEWKSQFIVYSFVNVDIYGDIKTRVNNFNTSDYRDNELAENDGKPEK